MIRRCPPPAAKLLHYHGTDDSTHKVLPPGGIQCYWLYANKEVLCVLRRGVQQCTAAFSSNLAKSPSFHMFCPLFSWMSTNSHVRNKGLQQATLQRGCEDVVPHKNMPVMYHYSTGRTATCWRWTPIRAGYDIHNPLWSLSSPGWWRAFVENCSILGVNILHVRVFRSYFVFLNISVSEFSASVFFFSCAVRWLVA